ncbi:MAG: hypothetical protein GWN07_10375, partial [Actinobacteria bacterium]|nr:hypothetical protein [Actinomycetota bacterium]NIS30690.1 hypothetical protein [Actinomycetota bacterium]NIU65900.1 hypothetical protein [Actinomycetota bacterium]NIV86771.1 hypothetical protein [Actinomycetota bacterium]NIW27691.1 hypothetical protein [Actinomycetota bacterium]
SCGLTSDGRTFCWGGNFEGALGIGEIEGPEICGRATLPDCSTAPVEVAGGLAFETISLGIQHGCAEAADGIAYCWGANLAGEVGDGTVESRPAPVRVFGQ